jgi:integrase/recombinase XerD
MRLDRAIDSYLRHISIERGLSDNTVAAYRRDLAGYAAWLVERDITDTDLVQPDTVRAFAEHAATADPPPAASSLARLQSSVRGLHRFLAREGEAVADPTTKLVPPKQPQKLPKAPTGSATERCSNCSMRPARASARPSASTSTTCATATSSA